MLRLNGSVSKINDIQKVLSVVVPKSALNKIFCESKRVFKQK